MTVRVPDEEEELIGEISAGLTDDEGIEDDHDDTTESLRDQTGVKSVRTSGTCEALLSLCR